MIAVGLEASRTFVVADGDTAAALGSGDLAVLATPRLLAWSEAVTCDAVRAELMPGQTTVGSRVSLTHERPSPVGARLGVRAALVHQDGRLLRFEVVAEDEDGTVVGRGEITRVVVDGERFLSRLG